MHAYRADTAFDGDRRLPYGVTVLVDGGRIVGVEDASAAVPVDCDVTHLPGTTLLPGLIDTHAHLCGDSGPAALEQLGTLSAAELDDIITTALEQNLRAGVTTIRDLGDRNWAVVERRDREETRPAIVAAGPPITAVGGHCWNMGGEAAGPEQLRRAVAERAERGADVVKIMTSGGVMTAGTDLLACQFTLEELRLVVDEAHRLGLPVTGHAHALPAVEQCIAAGVDGIEHCSCMVAGGIDTPARVLDALAAAGTYVCPTLGRAPDVEIPPQIQAVMDRLGLTPEGHLAQVAQMYAGGLTLVSGGDSGISPGKPHGILPHAIAELVEAGVPSDTALASATGTAADACGVSGRTGRLQAGLDADLLLVDGDPMHDVAALLDVRAVVVRGAEVALGSPPERG